MKKLLIPFLFLLSACATDQKPAGKITLSRETASSFQQYMSRIGNNQPGAFAVSLNGRNSYYVWCQAIRCMGGPTYKQDALRACEEYGEDCVILAYRNKAVIAYDVAQ